MDGEALEALRYFSDETHPQSFVTLAGRGPVLLSAPHAVLQTRSGRLKAAERYTGMLCLLLNRRYDVPCIYKSRHLMDDANHDPASPYRDEVCRLIREEGVRFVLDLHQLRPDRAMALCIGTGWGRHLHAFSNAPDVVRGAFARRGFLPVTLDDPFSAAARAGAGAMQLEINSALLMEDSPGERFGDVLAALAEAVDGLSAMLRAHGES